MFEQTRVRNALLPPCALVAVADLLSSASGDPASRDLVGGASGDPTDCQRRLSVTEAARDGTLYRAAESLNPPTPLQTPAVPRAAQTVADVHSDVGSYRAEDGGQNRYYRSDVFDGYHSLGSPNCGEGSGALGGSYFEGDRTGHRQGHSDAAYRRSEVYDSDELEEGEVKRSAAYDAVVQHLNWQFHRRRTDDKNNIASEHLDEWKESTVHSKLAGAYQSQAEPEQFNNSHDSVEPSNSAFAESQRLDVGIVNPASDEHGGETDRLEIADAAAATVEDARRPTQYAQSLKKSQQFQSVENMRTSAPPAPMPRLHVSTPELSSADGRGAALTAFREMTPPPPEHPPPPPPDGNTEQTVYDAPRQRPKMSVSVDDLLAEVVGLRKENKILHYQVRHSRRPTPTRRGDSQSDSQRARRREEALRAAQRHSDALERENDRLVETNRRLSAENGQLRAEPSREDSAILRQLVVRLSEQLARRQGLPPPEPADESVVTDTRRLPPLLDAYDQVQAELTEQADTLRADLSELRRQLTEVTAENEKLHEEIAGSKNKPAVTHQEWRSLSENARLVLEENQLLKQQVQLLKERQAAATDELKQRESELTARAAELEDSCGQLRARLQTEQQLQRRLQQECDRLQQQLASCLPQQQHEQAVGECRRLFEELRGQYTSDRLSLLADTEALQAERRRLLVQLTDAAAQRINIETQLRTATKTAARLEKRVATLQEELEAAQKTNAQATEHLAEVLSASDQLMAERSQLTLVNNNQLSDGDRLLDEISEQRAINVKLKDKVKTVRKESLQRLDQLQFEMGDQARSHESRIAEYERQLVYLRCRLNEKEAEVEHLQTENKRVGEEMNILSRAATAENQKLRQQLQNVPERETSRTGSCSDGSAK